MRLKPTHTQTQPLFTPTFIPHPPPPILPLLVTLSIILFTPHCLTATTSPPQPTPDPPSPLSKDLPSLIEHALEHNLELQITRKEIEKAVGAQIQARSVRYPKLSLESRIELRDQNLFNQSPPPIAGLDDYWIIHLYIHHPLYSGGANPNKIAIANLHHSNQLLLLEEKTQDLIAQIKETYYTLILRNLEIQAQEQALSVLKKEIARQQALFDAGQSPRFNLLRTQVAYNNIIPELDSLKNDAYRLLLHLAQLIGLPHHLYPSHLKLSHLPPSLPSPPRRPPNLESLTTAIQKRAEKKRLHNLSRIASHQIAIERSALYPKIDAFVSTRTRHSDPPSTRPSFFQTTQEIAFGILARWDIFDGFLAQGKILQAQAQADIAATQETQWLQHTHAQARLLTSEILSLHYILQKQQQNVSLAKQALDLAQDSHAHGQLSLLDLLQANLDFTRARLHELKSLHRLLVAYTQLDRLIGHPPIHIHPSSLKISQQ
ncbi:MAG: TolC family protein [Methylacidiphilales bacterium]|nr:TolC family protein [Candidatus Methylacidiphilales bacterium]